MTQSVFKILAMLTMLIDHIGIFLLPEVSWLRIIGRLAFPIFAYLIAEGCIHTKNHNKYLLRILICAVIFQVIDCGLRPGCPPCVLWSYAAAVGFVILHKWAKKKWSTRSVLSIAYVAIASILLFALKVDYLCFGFLFIISAYLLHKHWARWIPMTISLLLVGFCYPYQLWCLAVIPLLLLYNGKQDKLRMGRLMYYFYPVHYLILGVLGYVL